MVNKGWMIAIATLLLAPSVQAAEPVTEQQLVQGYLQQQQINQWLQEKYKALEAEREGAAPWANPELEFTYEPTPTLDGVDATESSVWLTQSLGAWGVRSNLHSAAEHREAVRKLQLQLELRDQVVRLKHDFYQLVLLRDLHQRYLSWSEQMNQLAQASAEQLEVGEQAELDHFRIQQEATAATLKLSEIEQKIHQHTAQLEQQTGVKLQNIEATLMPQALAQETLNLQLPTEFLEMKQLREQREQLVANQQSESSKKFPEVSVGVGLKQIEVDQQSGSEAAFKLGVSIPIFQRGQYQSAALASEISALEIEMQRTQNALTAQFSALKSQLQSTLKALANTQFQDNTQMLRTATEAYWLGELSVTELIDVQRTAIEVTEQQLTNQFAARNYFLQLQALSNPLKEIQP